ncbi:hypothetical protein [uncultured Clostridium sp.]|uniref:hypothetical protein n=1 Tax=uncultured Clostridium sp. TaxID=59620 RepID=UPI002628125F|nr:hypothetical protein [uncultured Clostridium sp.]
MRNIIKLLKERNFKKKLEELEIIEIDSENYYYPEFVFFSNSNELLDVKFSKEWEDSIKEPINSLVTRDEQMVAIILKEEKENGKEVFEIFNPDTEDVIKIPVNMDNSKENRELFIKCIAKSINKNNVEVIFYKDMNKDEVMEEIS